VLQEIQLDKNRVSSIPTGLLVPLTSLTKLSLRDNKATDIPDDLADLQSLKVIEYRGNFITRYNKVYYISDITVYLPNYWPAQETTLKTNLFFRFQYQMKSSLGFILAV
jgi:Leucine-rich repeat (LRR) protein